ncbi:DUF2225 domain-containing protein [Fusibacter paucivorans]|uniref:DUF2225 domain-containing protein n=1 Tax=Fusibacter paucivorans TaxID=76009 RepID=A0ABS5PRD4_9FIRM|nr:DUF2225 domain-containing protein [Fusibacter paucivorans]MBS7526622.1 DUF2225 domain-containing protein [Fusibacter paucivorans]
MINEMELKPESTLYSIGDVIEGLFLVKSGAVGLSRSTSGPDVFVEVIRPGAFVEPERALAGEHAVYTAKILEPSVICYIHLNYLDQYISTHPLKAMELLTYMSDMLENYNDKLTMGECHYSKKAVEIIKDESDFRINAKRHYHKQLPAVHQEYLFSKEVVCPVCEYTFKVNQVKASKMEFDHMDDDFRKHFYDIDELWYQIWRCPYCHYTHFSNEFHKINNLVRAELKVTLPRYETPQHEVLIKENYQQIFDDIYQMNLLIQQITKSSFVKARLWQTYAWLLDDVGDQATALEARKVLKVYYEDAWYNGTMALSQDDEIKLAIKLARLCAEFDDIRGAKNYLLKVVQMKPRNKVLLKKAQDMIYDYKKL